MEKRSEDSEEEPWKTEDIFFSDRPSATVSSKPSPFWNEDDSDSEDENISEEEMDSLRRELFPPGYDLDFDDEPRAPNVPLIIGWVAGLTMIVSAILSVFFFPLIAITLISMMIFFIDFIIFSI